MATIPLEQLDLQSAFDLAIAMEEEARERYESFTRQVGGRYDGDAADMFRAMASYEAKHAAELLARRRQIFGDAPARIRPEMLDDLEAPTRNAPRVFMSARDAMEIALRSEEKAYEFFDAALRYIKEPEVRRLFEELRGEEDQHRQMVRARLDRLPPGPDVEESEADEPGSDAGN